MLDQQEPTNLILMCPLSPAGGAVMLLVYEYVSGWLQKNW